MSVLEFDKKKRKPTTWKQQCPCGLVAGWLGLCYTHRKVIPLALRRKILKLEDGTPEKAFAVSYAVKIASEYFASRKRR